MLKKMEEPTTLELLAMLEDTKTKIQKDIGQMLKILDDNLVDEFITIIQKSNIDEPYFKYFFNSQYRGKEKDWDGVTLLIYAIQKKKNAVVNSLINLKVTDVNAQDSKRKGTPLYWAVLMRNEEVVKTLLAKNADADIQNIQGDTPLHVAVTMQNYNIVEMLVKLTNSKAISIKNNLQETPVEQTQYIQSEKIKLLLANYDSLQKSRAMTPQRLCPICRNNFTDNKDVVRLACGHLFHRKCIQTWVNMGKPMCPKCRKPIETEIEKLPTATDDLYFSRQFRF